MRAKTSYALILVASTLLLEVSEAFLSIPLHNVRCVQGLRPTFSSRRTCKGVFSWPLQMQRDPQAASPASKSSGKLVKFKAADMEIVRPLGEMGFATVTDVRRIRSIVCLFQTLTGALQAFSCTS
jgi:hypothetical protein